MKAEYSFRGFCMMRVLLFCLMLHLRRLSGGEVPALNSDGSDEDAVDEGGNAGAGHPYPREEDVGGGQEGGSGESSTEDIEGADLLLYFMCGHESPAQD